MTSHTMTRRAMLAALATIATSVAAPLRAYQGENLAGSLATLPPDFGRGRSVAIIGAGLAGLTSAYYLSRVGFEVVVLEAEGRYGGHSLTVRPQSDAYRRYFHERYGIGEETYVDRFAEEGGPEQVCTFNDDGWVPDTEEYPQELSSDTDRDSNREHLRRETWAQQGPEGTDRSPSPL